MTYQSYYIVRVHPRTVPDTLYMFIHKYIGFLENSKITQAIKITILIGLFGNSNFFLEKSLECPGGTPLDIVYVGVRPRPLKKAHIFILYPSADRLLSADGTFSQV